MTGLSALLIILIGAQTLPQPFYEIEPPPERIRMSDADFKMSGRFLTCSHPVCRRECSFAEMDQANRILEERKSYSYGGGSDLEDELEELRERVEELEANQ